MSEMNTATPIIVPRRPVPEGAPTLGPSWRKVMLWVFVFLVAAPVVLSHAVVVLLRWAPPPTTAFMLQSPVSPIQYQWVPAERIAEPVRRAVIASEDQKFWTHKGFDFEAIDKALEHNRSNRRKRGASTITQQVTKNLFLWRGRSWLRKGMEIYGTMLIELLWPKQRILEIYLNIAEFGPGIYGVEAASQEFFGKHAANLSPAEAARLAAVLPNPRRWHAANPGAYVQARSNWILAQMGYEPVGRRPILEEPVEPLAEEVSPQEPEMPPEPGTDTGTGQEPAPEPPADTAPSDVPPDETAAPEKAEPAAPEAEPPR